MYENSFYPNLRMNVKSEQHLPRWANERVCKFELRVTVTAHLLKHRRKDYTDHSADPAGHYLVSVNNRNGRTFS